MMFVPGFAGRRIWIYDKASFCQIMFLSGFAGRKILYGVRHSRASRQIFKPGKAGHKKLEVFIMQMQNIPNVKIGIVAVSRDCFPESLSVNRRKALVEAYGKKFDGADIYECPICIVESEIHMVQALEDIKKAGCNALCVYLGNFGPEISETLLAKHFDGPKMFVGAAEESQDSLLDGRGDAYCGMLNASYNLRLRNIGAYIPEYPVGDAEDLAEMIH